MSKGTRETGRLGWGEYQPPGPNQMGRVAFMEAILRHAPAVFDDLISIEAQTTGRVEDRLDVWAKKWRLTHAWIIGIARTTLHTRREVEALRTRRGWWFPGRLVVAPSWPELGWDPPESAAKSISGEEGRGGWDPEMESETAFRKRVDRHILRVHALAEASGFVRVRDKRHPEHFDWLVLYHVSGWTMPQISETYQDAAGLDISTVSRAITQTAALIDLTVRRSRGPHRPVKARR
jgi:hypothetical protein